LFISGRGGGRKPTQVIRLKLGGVADPGVSYFLQKCFDYFTLLLNTLHFLA
jgi:hypothetical protein